ncbi:hypothetical protein IGI04_030883, partial [Brassica rapa subsp. trilocularis]
GQIETHHEGRRFSCSSRRLLRLLRDRRSLETHDRSKPTTKDNVPLAPSQEGSNPTKDDVSLSLSLSLSLCPEGASSDDAKPPRTTFASVLTASPPTMQSHHGRRRLWSSRRLLRRVSRSSLRSLPKVESM